MSSRNRIILVIVLALGIAGWKSWQKWAAPTNIALLNYSTFQAANLSLSNNDRFIRFETVSLDELTRLKHFDFILGNGMGMKLTEEQRTQIETVKEKGIPIAFYSVTNPMNDITNLDSLNHETIKEYLSNGNKANYQNMARYIRQYIDKKSFFVHPAASLVENVSEAYFHLDEEVSFETLEDFEGYLKKNDFWNEGGGKVAVIAGIHDPFSGNKAHIDSLIVSLHRSGLNAYPIVSSNQRLKFLEEVNPDAVIYFPHGRLLMADSDATVAWLKKQNIPFFTPLSIMELEEDWLKNPMGMYGGFMGQTVAIPELDGALYPYALIALEKTRENMYALKTIPDRLKNFTDIIHRMVALKYKENSEKKVAVYYFKGPGQSTLQAQGLEVVPSLYNLLRKLKEEGYKVENLPRNVEDFERILMTQGPVLSDYAEGTFEEFLENGDPQLIRKEDYEAWAQEILPDELYREVVEEYGEAPGPYMSVERSGEQYLAVARIPFGNVVLLPQPMAAYGEDDFKITHGADTPPPHPYIGSYLWTQRGFGADAIIHFGTHGSLEFTPQKQVALSKYDWPDRMIHTLPHFYYYTIANLGESMMAKRRTYATTISYLSPAFNESGMRSRFNDLQEEIREYFAATGETQQEKISLKIKKEAVEMGLHRDLRLDSILSQPYAAADIERLDNFAEEIATEKINGLYYTSGESYEPKQIRSTVLAMSTDPIAYSLAALDRQRGKTTDDLLKNKTYFTRQYLNPAKALVNQVLDGKPVDPALICQVAEIGEEELYKAHKITTPPDFSRMMAAGSDNNGASKSGEPGKPDFTSQVDSRPQQPSETTGSPDGSPAATDHKPSGEKGKKPSMAEIMKLAQGPEYSKEEKEKAEAISEIERTVTNILFYKNALAESPKNEFDALINALAGGYTSPSSGGDAVANPKAVPTGHNMYSINAETTPSRAAWDRGVALVDATLEQYREKHGELPRKVSYTFWSGEFIESEGTTIAQVFYMLGVRPVWDAFGRVADLHLIPSEELGRPRIDVVVQTSGQFRDLGASRLMLISRAVEMAAAAKDENRGNPVATGSVEIERMLVDQGMSPAKAREASMQRIFGGLNGMYGTGIRGMIESSDRWETEEEIAEVYLNNMGAAYGSETGWGDFQEGLFRAALQNTDVVIQPRQNNTWGALSLDHVYEFMGGLNLTVRNVTGKDPDAFFADYRNRHRAKIQDLKETIGVEARTTVLNPEYIREVMKGSAGSAGQISDIITNTFGWNVTKPEVIENEFWNQLYETYVQDAQNLGIVEHFERTNPAALQEMTAVMIESARKGMWPASEAQLQDLVQLHTDLVEKYGSSGAGFSGGNAKLQDFIAEKASPENGLAYKKQIENMKTSVFNEVPGKDGVVLRKDNTAGWEDGSETRLNGMLVGSGIVALFFILLMILRKKRKRSY